MSAAEFEELQAKLAAAIADKDAVVAALAAASAEIAILRSPPEHGRFTRVTPHITAVKLASRTKGRGAEALLLDPFTGFLGAPISLAAASGTGESFKGVWRACGQSPRGLMKESFFYDLAVKHVPPFAEQLGSRGDAHLAYGVTTPPSLCI